MRDSWLKVIDRVLRPARTHLERCLGERDRHLVARRLVTEQRALEVAGCVARIEGARAAVFAANDGIVTSRMTDLEREWRVLSRSDPDGGLMDLWARIAPSTWIDRKLWRDSDPADRLDAAIALASDVEGVEAAGFAIGSLRVALAPWGTPIGPRIRWRSFKQDSDSTADSFAEPLRAAREALSARGMESVVVERAQDLEQGVRKAVCARFPERPLLAQSLARAAFVDCVWRAASLTERPNPVTPLCELLATGYVLSAIDASGVTVEIPPLPGSVPGLSGGSAS